LPKDNENIRLPDLTSIEPSESKAFTPDQMVRCDECLRANPPTRVNCLYCAAVLPVHEHTANLQKPALRRLEKWELGYNVLLEKSADRLSEAALNEAADLLKVKPEVLTKLLAAGSHLPLARVGSPDEAELILRRLAALGIAVSELPDAQLGSEDSVLRIRRLEIDRENITAYQIAGAEGLGGSFAQVVLLVVGRLLTKRLEVKERKSRGAEADIIDASEFYNDESVLDIYRDKDPQPWRIVATSFDFSCLGAEKGLLAGENFSRLLNLFKAHAPQAKVDAAYDSLHQLLEIAWPVEQRTESSGWHRDRPGKYSIGGVTQSSNEGQFTRYSRLQYHSLLASQDRTG